MQCVVRMSVLAYTHVPAKLHTQACETFMYFALYSVIWAGYGVKVPLCFSGTSQEGLREWFLVWNGRFLSSPLQSLLYPLGTDLGHKGALGDAEHVNQSPISKLRPH